MLPSSFHHRLSAKVALDGTAVHPEWTTAQLLGQEG